MSLHRVPFPPRWDREGSPEVSGKATLPVTLHYNWFVQLPCLVKVHTLAQEPERTQSLR